MPVYPGAPKRHGRKTITLRQITRRSPNGHQTHILTKLEVDSRGEAAALAHRHGLTR